MHSLSVSFCISVQIYLKSSLRSASKHFAANQIVTCTLRTLHYMYLNCRHGIHRFLKHLTIGALWIPTTKTALTVSDLYANPHFPCRALDTALTNSKTMLSKCQTQIKTMRVLQSRKNWWQTNQLSLLKSLDSLSQLLQQNSPLSTTAWARCPMAPTKEFS